MKKKKEDAMKCRRRRKKKRNMFLNKANGRRKIEMPLPNAMP